MDETQDGASSWAQRISSWSRMIQPLNWKQMSHKLGIFVSLLGGALAVWVAYRNQSNAKELLTAAWVGLLGTYGAWAIARELLVDEDFLALLGGITALWVLWSGRDWSLLMLYAGLAQIRMLQRAPGTTATLIDSLVVLGLTLGAMYTNQSMVFWFSGFIAFLLDAAIKTRSWRPLIFALLCAAGGVYYDLSNKHMMRELGFLTMPPWSFRLLGLSVLLLIGGFWVGAKNAVEAAPIPPRGRIIAAMVVISLCAIMPWFGGYFGLLNAGFLWAAMAGAALGVVLIPLKRRFASL